MKIICISVGTRGDIEPFAALTELLQKAGHEVICAYPAQYENLAIETKAEFFPLKKEFLEMLESTEGKAALGGGGNLWGRFKAMYGLYKQNTLVSFQLLEQQKELIERESPDLILHSLKAFYPIFWNISHPGKVALISPIPCVIHPIEEMSSIFLNGKDYGKWINKKSYSLMRNLSMRFFKKQLKRLGIMADQKDLDHSFKTEKLLYTISPSLYEEKAYWPDQVKVIGYLERTKTNHWHPPDALQTFLENNPNPLFVTFGSMTNPDPAGKTDFILDILARNKIAAIINTAGGGLLEPTEYDRDSIFFVGDIPYDWIFPKVRAVVHHGGAGTTHLALKYGCASMIIPHIPDQHLWNRIISQRGLGPKGLSIRKFIHKQTEENIVDLVSNPAYKKEAENISIKLLREDFDDEILALLTD